jgi:hypothetical protein
MVAYSWGIGSLNNQIQTQVRRPLQLLIHNFWLYLWALGYDLIRSWVFNDSQRLSDFNLKLKDPQVVDYHDFFAIGEQRVLETCRDAAGSLTAFTGKTFRTLHAMLDDRNNFAHANYAQATPEEAVVYVQRLIRVVTSPPFI